MALLTDDVIEDLGVLSIIYVLGLKTTPKQSPKGRVDWFVLINVLKLDLFCLTILNLSVSFCYNSTEAHHQKSLSPYTVYSNKLQRNSFRILTVTADHTYRIGWKFGIIIVNIQDFDG